MKSTFITYPNTKGQIVIPQAVRSALGITPGCPLHLTIQGDAIRLAPIEHVIEKGAHDRSFMELLKLTHGAWVNEPTDAKEEKRRRLELVASRRRSKAW